MLYIFLALALHQVPADDEPSLEIDPPPAVGTDSPEVTGNPAETDPTAEPGTEPTPPDGADPTDAEDEEEEATDPADSFWSKVDESLNSGAIGLLRQGGPFMWPLLLMAIIAAGVIMERYRSLKMLTSDSRQVRQEVAMLLQTNQVEAALSICDNEQGPVPAILSAGLRKFLVLRRLNYDPEKIDEQVLKGMDDYSIHIVAALERHLPILATISSVAPMLGFLGTVQGMIVAFRNIVEQMGETNIVESAASGIQVSLLTTCFGLIVGIPAFIAFNYFTSVINRVVLEVEESATELVENVTLELALGDQK
jgi:biopolymer transport protein ExbB